MLLNISMCLEMLFLWGLQEQDFIINCIHLRKLTSTKQHSDGNGCVDKSVVGTSFLTYSKVPPSWTFWSIRKGSLKSFIKNVVLGKLSSIFVSEKISKSTSPLTFCMRAWNLFLSELIFKCATTSLFKFGELVSDG